MRYSNECGLGNFRALSTACTTVGERVEMTRSKGTFTIAPIIREMSQRMSRTVSGTTRIPLVFLCSRSYWSKWVSMQPPGVSDPFHRSTTVYRPNLSTPWVAMLNASEPLSTKRTLKQRRYDTSVRCFLCPNPFDKEWTGGQTRGKQAGSLDAVSRRPVVPAREGHT